jgi:hypothetical protein
VFFRSRFGRDGLECMLCNRPAYKRACNCDTGDNGDRSYSCQYQEDGLRSLRASLLDDVKEEQSKADSEIPLLCSVYRDRSSKSETKCGQRRAEAFKVVGRLF